MDMMNLDVLAFIDHNITVNIIKNGEIVKKKELILFTAKIPAASPPLSRDFLIFSFSPMRKKKYTAANTAKRNSTGVLYYKQEEEKILPALLYYRAAVFFLPDIFFCYNGSCSCPLTFSSNCRQSICI